MEPWAPGAFLIACGLLAFALGQYLSEWHERQLKNPGPPNKRPKPKPLAASVNKAVSVIDVGHLTRKEATKVIEKQIVRTHNPYPHHLFVTKEIEGVEKKPEWLGHTQRCDTPAYASSKVRFIGHLKIEDVQFDLFWDTEKGKRPQGDGDQSAIIFVDAKGDSSYRGWCVTERISKHFHNNRATPSAQALYEGYQRAMYLKEREDQQPVVEETKPEEWLAHKQRCDTPKAAPYTIRFIGHFEAEGKQYDLFWEPDLSGIRFVEIKGEIKGDHRGWAIIDHIAEHYQRTTLPDGQAFYEGYQRSKYLKEKEAREKDAQPSTEESKPEWLAHKQRFNTPKDASQNVRFVGNFKLDEREYDLFWDPDKHPHGGHGEIEAVFYTTEKRGGGWNPFPSMPKFCQNPGTSDGYAIAEAYKRAMYLKEKEAKKDGPCSTVELLSSAPFDRADWVGAEPWEHHKQRVSPPSNLVTKKLRFLGSFVNGEYDYDLFWDPDIADELRSNMGNDKEAVWHQMVNDQGEAVKHGNGWMPLRKMESFTECPMLSEAYRRTMILKERETESTKPEAGIPQPMTNRWRPYLHNIQSEGEETKPEDWESHTQRCNAPKRIVTDKLRFLGHFTEYDNQYDLFWDPDGPATRLMQSNINKEAVLYVRIIDGNPYSGWMPFEQMSTTYGGSQALVEAYRRAMILKEREKKQQEVPQFFLSPKSERPYVYVIHCTLPGRLPTYWYGYYYCLSNKVGNQVERNDGIPRLAEIEITAQDCQRWLKLHGVPDLHFTQLPREPVPSWNKA